MKFIYAQHVNHFSYTFNHVSISTDKTGLWSISLSGKQYLVKVVVIIYYDVNNR